MTLSNEPVTLTPEQVAQLKAQLSEMRHDINNSLALILAASEIIKRKPETADRMLTTLAEQPPRIMAATKKFSTHLDQVLGLARP